MGPHLPMRWETRDSSRLVVGNSAFISSWDGDPGPPWFVEICSASSPVFRGNLGLLSRRCSRKWPHLTLTGESCGLSQVVAGSLRFLSSYDWELRAPLVLAQWSQVSTRVVRVSAGVFLSHSRGIRPQFAWKGQSQVVSRVVTGSVGSLELRWGPEGASHVVSGKLWSLLNCEGPLRIPLELVQGTRPSSLLEAGNSGSFWFTFSLVFGGSVKISEISSG